jgi:RHS repeat-associated protein
MMLCTTRNARLQHLATLVMLLAFGRQSHAAIEKASEQVSPFYGSLSRSVPIEVPSFHGLEPKLAFTYSSEGRNGFLGVGWRLSGISTIERVNAGLGTPRWGATDTFILDGQPLIACVAGMQSPSCTSGGTHATKDESYLKILFESTANTWTVWGRDGTRTIFLPILQPATNHTLRWGQTSTIDTKGNTISTTWTCLPGEECYPEAIAYNGYSVSFGRELPTRPDVLTFAAGDIVTKMQYRLRTVFVWLGSPGVGTPIRAYRALYSTSPITGRSLLSSIEQFGKNVNQGGASLPAQTFTYQNDTLGKGFYPISGDPPTPPATLENVVWTNLVNVQANGNDVTKTGGGSQWNAGAASTRALASGDGYIEVKTVLGAHIIFGLNNGDGGVDPNEIDFALWENNEPPVPSLYVKENGHQFGPYGALQAGEPLRIEIQGSHVVYKKGTTVIRDVQRHLTYPLLLDASIFTGGGTVDDAILYGSLQYITHWCGEELVTADVNGDGRTDQICHRSSVTDVALATPTGFDAATTWLSSGYNKFTIGDFNSDGKADLAIMAEDQESVKVALSTGTAFAEPVVWGSSIVYGSSGAAHSCKPALPFYPYVVFGTGDFNGDGRTDFSCHLVGKEEEIIGLANAAGTGFNFSLFSEYACDFVERTGAIDFDGDGMDDWYCIGATYGNLYVMISTGSSFQFPQFWLDNTFCDFPNYVLGDFNGDGRTDAACTNGKVALSTGHHFEVQTQTPMSWCSSPTGVFAADVDGDGASEIICNNANAPSNDIEIRKWTGGALGPPETWKASWCGASVQAGDFNGDGKTDLVCSALSSPAVAGTGGFQSDLLASAGNSLGGTSQTTYTSSVNFPNTNNPGPKWVVSARSINDGRGGISSTSYTYAGGYMDRAERRFLGFRTVTETLPCIDGDCPSVVTTLKQDLPSAGKPEKIERRDGTGYVLRTNEYDYTTTASPPRTSLLTEERSFFSDETGPAKETRAVHQYDAYGNRVQTVFHGDVDEGGDELTSTWAFSANTSAYIVNRPSLEQQFEGEDIGGAKLSERQYFYDGSLTWGVPPSQGFLTRVDSWLDLEARYVSRTMLYDSWGNLTEARDETNRPIFTVWDSTYHVYPTSVTNGANPPETETANWDAVCGVPLERHDANNQLTTYQTDNYCRPSVTTYPLGGFENRTYPNLGNATTQHIRIETPSALQGIGSLNDYVLEYFDGLGRTYKTVKKGIPTRPTIRTDVAYNARGGRASDTAPYYDGYEPVRTTSYKVDSLDRLTESLFPDTNKVQKDYGIWRETTTDEHGHPTTVRFDAYGRKKQTEQHVNTDTLLTDYTYNLLGRLTGLRDPIGIEWSWTFDSLGRLVAKADPDSGAWSYDYDDAGRLLQQTDAKSQQTTFLYDGAGRLLTKTNSAGVVTIQHSEVRAGYFNIGHVTSVATTAGGLSLDYDAAGRTVRQGRLLDGILYIAYRRYDSAGRLRGITYPDNDTIGTEANPLLYDAAGRLYAIPGILTEILYDGAGRPTSQKAADNAQTVTTKTYSSRGALTDIATANGAIQNLHYQLDPAGLVDWVTSSVANEGWDYSYDELHRMWSAQSFGDPNQSQTFEYDSIGRITSSFKGGLYTIYTYPPVGLPHPHAPATVAGGQYNYDGNGNLSSGGDRTFQWNADNLVTQVTKAGAITTFTYDGLGERVKKTSAGSASLYPMGDDYEITTGVITKYVSVVGLGLVAKRTPNGTFWLHTDRLGSIQAITDATGAEVQRRTYRPYGDKIADTTSHIESRGYIDQRQDAETGLTYLHARYYDSALGIFISPDPFSPALLGVVKHRYGYGDGNPVNETDRSGYYPIPECFLNDDGLPDCHWADMEDFDLPAWFWDDWTDDEPKPSPGGGYGGNGNDGGDGTVTCQSDDCPEPAPSDPTPPPPGNVPNGPKPNHQEGLTVAFGAGGDAGTLAVGAGGNISAFGWIDYDSYDADMSELGLAFTARQAISPFFFASGSVFGKFGWGGAPSDSSVGLNLVIGPLTIGASRDSVTVGLGPSWPPIWVYATVECSSTVGTQGIDSSCRR